MSKKRHPNECGKCGYFPCRCPGGGGGGDENSKDKNASDNAEKDSSFIHSINITNRPAWCTLFAATTNQLVPTPSSYLQEENDSTNNTSSMGIK